MKLSHSERRKRYWESFLRLLSLRSIEAADSFRRVEEHRVQAGVRRMAVEVVASVGEARRVLRIEF